MNFKTLWTRISVLLAALLVISYITYSCSDSGDPCDSYISFVSPSVVSVKNYEPWYYTPEYEFNECNLDDSNKELHNVNELNVAEWSAYVQSPMPNHSISDFIYNYSLNDLTNLYYHIEKNNALQVTDSIKNNDMLLWFIKNKDLEALGYLLYAKKCEPLAISTRNEWEEPKPLDTASNLRLIKNGLQLFNAAKSDFCKQRYLFQVVRTAFYNHNYSRAIVIYDSLVSPKLNVSASISERLRSYKAGSLFKLGKKTEASYEFSKLFDHAHDYDFKFGHYLGYLWSSDSTKMNAVLLLCKNNHEKAVLYAMQGFQHSDAYNFNALQHVYSLDSKNEMLDVLLIREVNKIEQDYTDYKYKVEQGIRFYELYFGNIDGHFSKEELANWLESKHRKEMYLQKNIDFIVQTANENKLSNKSLWLSSAAYLNLMNEHYAETDKLLNEAEHANPSIKVSNQINLFKLLSKLSQQTEMNATFEASILPQLKWLESISRKEKMFAKPYRDLFGSLLPIKYIQSKDSLKTLLCYAKYEQLQSYQYQVNEPEVSISSFEDKYWTRSGQLLDKRFSIQQLDALKYYNSNKRTAYETWLSQNNVYSNDVLNELKAVKFLREAKFTEASNTLKNTKQIPSICNPFVAHIRDFHEEYNEDTLVTFSLKQLSDTLAKLELSASNNLINAFDLACALYSMSYHGKCGRAISYYRPSSDVEPYYFLSNKNHTPYYMQYYYTDASYRLFQQVVLKSKDPLQKQKATWMLAKCFQHRYPKELENTYGYSNDGKGDVYSNWATYQNPYLKDFQKNYKGTPFYDQVYSECSYLRNFVSK